MPGVRVTSVRRTVAVAVTLVTAQALLGAVIGFVTFGGEETAPATTVAEPQLAGPPIVVPPTLAAPAERLSIAASRGVRTERPTSPPVTPAAKRRPVTPATTPSPSPPVGKSAPPVPPMPPISDPGTGLESPSAPGQDDPPVPVVGERCDEEGADGRTADNKAVRCVRGRGGDLRWRLVQ